ncbi:site-2 protease family protein [Mariniluteicoccus endophyticus]
MDTVIYLTGAILFFALIMASIALHEIGHMVPAKLFDVKVTQYFVGFGRTIRSWRRGETEYGFKWIPLGGYVKLVGMYPPDKQGHVKSGSSNVLASMIDASREAEWEDIRPEDDGRLFYQKKTWQKLIIMAGGPVMNLVLAFFIMWGVTSIHGVWRPQPVVAQVQECMVPADRNEKTCQPTDPKTPAFQAGLQPGDRVVAFNGQQVTDWAQMQTIIRANLDAEARMVVERGGQRVELPVVKTVITGVADKLDPSKRVQAGFLGMTPTTEKVHGGPVSTLKDMGAMTEQSLYALARFPVKVYNVAADLVSGKPRDPYGPMSIVGASRAAGEISSTDQITAADKVATFMSLLGGVNLFVALFNFVPLLPLDGGHIAGAISEWLRRVGAKVFGRPDPGPLDTAKMLPIAYVVFAFVTLSGVVLILADLIDPVKLF